MGIDLILKFLVQQPFKEINIDRIIMMGTLVLVLTGCATLRDSLVLGASTGVVAGAVAGSQVKGDTGENAIKGAVLGGVVGGLASYLIHEALESRDARVRKDTLMNLEKYDVMGRPVGSGDEPESVHKDKCFTTQEVDGHLSSIPCRYMDESGGGQ